MSCQVLFSKKMKIKALNCWRLNKRHSLAVCKFCLLNTKGSVNALIHADYNIFDNISK